MPRKKKPTEKAEDFIAQQLAYLLDGADYYDPKRPPERQFEAIYVQGSKFVLVAECGEFVVTVLPRLEVATAAAARHDEP